ncbi:hypothetical protein [Amycolatopsis jiangsuensis]|uniref:Excreted virulence factor EspC (Type VII ESX diderm) n=1 Tax=Amycolatopsis jiangsuensis TaxID=1181879 RepID=A0A840IRR5_9PSEU|nr:hypothetical protein [Amycolatopsis jiangsuensis]MBB4683858.1 hypothetical protein [Amycolatopsis jiangsuensis]
MSGGYSLDPKALEKFGNHLDGLADNLRGSGEMIGGCVADPGIFGVVGQLFGAGASLHCGKARDQLTSYADSVGKFRENLDKARKGYQDQEDDVTDSISKYQA